MLFMLSYVATSYCSDEALISRYFMAHGGARPGAGKPKGYKAPHTLEASILKQRLIAAYSERADEINEALVNKALTGDIPAIKELHDRVHGKAMQPMEMTGKDGAPLTEPSGEIISLANELRAAIRNKRGNSTGN